MNEVRLRAQNQSTTHARPAEVAATPGPTGHASTRPLRSGVGPDVIAFGDAPGECVQSVDTTGTAVWRAGIAGMNFHDLRREAGSRLLESDMLEHYVHRFPDHPNLSTTSPSLKTTRRGMHEALGRVDERGNGCATVAQPTDSALPLSESPTEPQHTEPAVAEALTGQSLT